MTLNKTITGTINSIEDLGTIVITWITDEQGGETPVYWDHSSFRNLAEDEPNLIGLHVKTDGEIVEVL